MIDDNRNIASTQKRLEEIEKEIADLREKENALKLKWQQERNIIQQLRNSKAEIENLKQQADEFERNGNLAKVAELRYGIIPETQKKLVEANDKLQIIQESGKMLREEVDAEDIADIVAKWTGIPVQKMLESERMKLVKMEERIHQRLVNQNEAVFAIANAIRRSKAGLHDMNKPIGSFIFLGTTGVGKTEMARALAEFLFDDENSLVRIDMSEYMEKFSVSRLIGAPPGYVGYEEGGQLTEAVRRKPFSVVLLDEIEKAHADIFNILLQILEDGRLTDSKGRIVNFKNTIIIMTSNIGTELIQDKIQVINAENRDSLFADLKQKILDVLKKRMRPEFLNRIDEILLFKPLTEHEINQIALLQINNLIKKVEHSGMSLQISDDAVEWISKIGFDSQYGARPLKRAIQKHLVDPLSMMILEGKYLFGDKILIDTNEAGGFTFSKIN